MKENRRKMLRLSLARFAPAVFWAGVIVLVLGLLVVVSGATAGSGRGPVPTEYMVVGGLVLMLLSGLMNPAALQRMFSMRSVRYGSNAAVFTLGFLAVLGLLNYLGTQRQFNWRQDFTANKQFTLSPQTIQVLESLKTPVKAYAFIGADPATGSEPFNAQEIRDRLKEYALRSSNFTYEVVDPFQRPDLATELDVKFNGSVILTAGAKKQDTGGASESDFTGSIVKVTSDKARVVYFLTGHRERDINEFGNTGYSSAKSALERDNYSVSMFSFQLTTTVPTSATVLVLAGSRSLLNDDEAKALDAYLDQGGRLLVMADPRQPNPIPAILGKWGIQLRNDQVVDPQFIPGTSPLYPAVQQYTLSPISSKLKGLITVMPLVRSIKQVEPAPPSLTFESVIQSTPQSWGETELDFQAAQPRYDDGKDFKGPLDMALSVEGNAPGTAAPAGARKTRIVVVGTSEVVANNILQIRGSGNLDFFVNAVNWLAEEESLISIRPSTPDQRLLTLTSTQANLMVLLTVIVMPALVLLTGFSIWWRRR